MPERRDRKSIRWQEGSLQKQVMASISDMDLGTASDFLSMKNRDCHQNATVLQKNMTMTVEPGIYIPEFGGVRIEDLVVITEKGCRNLADSPKELIEL